MLQIYLTPFESFLTPSTITCPTLFAFIFSTNFDFDKTSTCSDANLPILLNTLPNPSARGFARLPIFVKNFITLGDLSMLAPFEAPQATAHPSRIPSDATLHTFAPFFIPSGMFSSSRISLNSRCLSL